MHDNCPALFHVLITLVKVFIFHIFFFSRSARTSWNTFVCQQEKCRPPTCTGLQSRQGIQICYSLLPFQLYGDHHHSRDSLTNLSIICILVLSLYILGCIIDRCVATRFISRFLFRDSFLNMGLNKHLLP